MTKRPTTSGSRKPTPTRLALRSGASSECWTRRWRNRTWHVRRFVAVQRNAGNGVISGLSAGGGSRHCPPRPQPKAAIRYDDKGRRSSALQKDSWRWNGLFIIADAAAQFPRSGDEAHLRNSRRGRAWLREHVADLGDLTFGLLPCGVEFQAKLLAGGVLERPHIHAGRNGNRACDGLPIRDSVAEWIEVAIPESALSLVEH